MFNLNKFLKSDLSKKMNIDEELINEVQKSFSEAIPTTSTSTTTTKAISIYSQFKKAAQQFKKTKQIEEYQPTYNEYSLNYYIELLNTITNNKKKDNNDIVYLDNKQYIGIIPIVYDPQNIKTNFEHLIKQNEYKNALFIFNDNVEYFINNSFNVGRGNAIIRPYKKSLMAYGIPTGILGTQLQKLSIDKTGIVKYTDTKGDILISKNIREYIDDAINNIIKIINTRSNDPVYFVKYLIYSANNDNIEIQLKTDTGMKNINVKNLGNTIFDVSDYIKKYIIEKIYNIPQIVFKELGNIAGNPNLDIFYIKKEYFGTTINLDAENKKLNNNTKYKIFTFSDIHADIDALIINLRDCAQVISKTNVYETFNTTYKTYGYGDTYQANNNILNIRKHNNDQFLEYLLKLNLNNTFTNDFNFMNKGKDYQNCNNLFNDFCNLGYEWTAENTYVIINGDLLDGYRPANIQNFDFIFKDVNGNIIYKNYNDLNQEEKQNSLYIHQYPQIEIKLLMFLNKLDEMAIKKNSRVIKLIGNHELSNFNTGGLINNNYYSFGNTINDKKLNNWNHKNENYFNKIERKNYFKYNEDGFKLFVKRGTGLLLQIILDGYSYIFVHAALYNKFNDKPTSTSTIDYSDKNIYNNIKNINRIINMKDINNNDFVQNNLNILSGLTESRYLGNTYDDNICTNAQYGLNKIFEDFCDNNINCNPDKVKLFIGHCPQYFFSTNISNALILSNVTKLNDNAYQFNCINTNCTTKINNVTSAILNNSNSEDYHNTYLFPGITVQCREPKTNNFNIYRVDVGVSRCFDTFNKDLNIIDERKNFIGRLPQVIKIDGDTISVIRTTIDNARKSQPRPHLEQLKLFGKNYLTYSGHVPSSGTGSGTGSILGLRTGSGPGLGPGLRTGTGLGLDLITETSLRESNSSSNEEESISNTDNSDIFLSMN